MKHCLTRKSRELYVLGSMSGTKRPLDGEERSAKCAKTVRIESWYSQMTHGKGQLIPQHTFDKFTNEDIKLLQEVKTSCTDATLIQKAIKFRKLHRLTIRLPEDTEDSSYYFENGLRKVYPYPYLYQSYTKRRWIGRKLIQVFKEEFRDIPEEQLRLRFSMQRILVNGEPIDDGYKMRDNDFLANRNHRHELAVLATPIKIIYEDKDTLVIDKPPSVPIHPCGRYRHNSIINILSKDYRYENVKVVHRLDRLASGVLIIARNTAQARKLEQMIQNRDVQKEYVCRVVGDFPEGEPEDDGFITVNEPLEIVPGKIGITVVFPEGKESLTKFKKLNYNGKTSAVLCQPRTGRMHQIRVHLQYLGHPIVNDGLYNCESFGPEKGKGGRYHKTLRQLSNDVIAAHRSNTWLVSEESDVIEDPLPERSETPSLPEETPEEKEETLAALGHYFTDESRKVMEEIKFDPSKLILDPHCRDCHSKYLDPPFKRLFLYLHALRYSGTGWTYQSEMPVWALESWKY